MNHSRGRGARKARVALFASTAALGAGQLAPAAAQEPGSAQPPGPVYEEIVVTARNRTERAQEVPVPISVLGGDVLDRDRAFGVVAVRPGTR